MLSVGGLQHAESIVSTYNRVQQSFRTEYSRQETLHYFAMVMLGTPARGTSVTVI